MATWQLWIAFNAGVALLLTLDLGLFHRRAHAVTLRQAALESTAWVALSAGFGAWIFFAYGREHGLEFFAGYLIEKSLSLDNVLIFALIFRYFRVEARYQHRLLFWGVLGALVLRGVMIGAGVVLILRFAWIFYFFGAFLFYAGLKLFRGEHSAHPENNPLVRWAQKVLPTAEAENGQALFAQQSGRLVFTPLFLVVLVLETTDLVLAIDSIPALFGVTRDPFLVYSSNVCAILGLRAFYFLLAGILPYFRYLDEGLGIVLMFIGGKMLAEPWVHVSTSLALAAVGAVIAVSILVSMVRAKPEADRAEQFQKRGRLRSRPIPPLPELLHDLQNSDPVVRARSAWFLFHQGTIQIAMAVNEWRKDASFDALVVLERIVRPHMEDVIHPRLTVGIAVQPETFEKIRAANGSPALADAPADQDVSEFELEFPGEIASRARLDILTTKAPAGGGAIARFLEKFGEGIQQVEIDVTDVDRASEILRQRFRLEPIYPAARPGANSTRVNFFLIATWNSGKALIELVEHPQASHESRVTNR